MSDAAVHTVPPIVNDPFGKCFVVPAMSACTCAKAAALVLVDVVLDMYVSLLSEGWREGRRGETLGAGVPRGVSASFSRPSYRHSRAGGRFRAGGEKIDLEGVDFEEVRERTRGNSAITRPPNVQAFAPP